MEKIIWLQSFDNYNVVCRYNYETKEIEKCSKSELMDKTIKFDGMFSEIGVNLFLMIKDRGSLIFIVNKNVINVTDDVLIEVTGKPSDRILKILKNNKLLYEIHYSLDGEKIIDGDPTPFIEEEDFDFGLFMSNISSDKNRKNILLGKE